MFIPRLCISLLIAGSCLYAQSGTAVFVITDAEGVAGVCRQELTETDSAELRALLTGEINAAVRGFLAAGADEVWVWDGHSSSRTLSALTIHPQAKLVQGSLSPTMLADRKFAAVAFVGQHARANRESAVMAHSYSSLGIQRLLMNGEEVGEIETRTALAGWYGIPVILLTGDKAAAEDLHAIVPQAEVAVVKEGLGYYSCVSLSSTESQELIERQAVAAFKKLDQIEPYRVEGPVTFEMELTTRNTPNPDDFAVDGIERVDARTRRYHGKDFLEAWLRWATR